LGSSPSGAPTSVSPTPKSQTHLLYPLFTVTHTTPRYPSTLFLARLSRRSGGRVRLRHGVVDINHDTGVRGCEGAREGDEVLGAVGARAAVDTNLGARDVELRTAGAACTMQANVLCAQQVLAVGKALGDGDADGFRTC
jgi:hypothetical protein